ncbi:PocR ligand-binding domain-containing protein [Pseudodesulfovibrio indicus]|uniref:PocR ligand-binding domain-containing protein n=1 Tax=Pseudodesulfovibrio indicus TaxID=1716143 RepID=UPI00292D80A5|nr:PocR ligand-binding domain-containing protein [Pseudodesulfovibrio indicus]
MEEKHYSFADLFDLDTILEVMKNFYALTSFPPSITDPEGNLMLTVGFKTLCRDFHRSHPETLKQCIESDTWMADRLDAKSGYACYDCLNGLTDVAMPIVIDGRHLANLFIGQFFTEPAPPEEFFLERAERYGFDRDAYMAAVAEIPVFTEAQVEQAATFMTGLAQLIGEMGLSQKRLAELNATLESRVQERTIRLKREETARKRALAEFEAIFNNSSVAIIEAKPPDTIYNVNKRFETIFGYERGEALGQSLHLLSPYREEYATRKKRDIEILRGGGMVHDECKLVTKDGRHIWCSYHGSPINPARLEDGVVLMLNDISERKELETLKEDVDRIMRHDLKVPLNGIVGFSQYLLMDDGLTETQREALQDILDSGLRMSDQINRSLEFYKIETGAFQYSPSETDLAAVARTALRDLTEDARRKRLDLRVEVPGRDDGARPLTALADAGLSCVMLSNLVKNSVEAAPEGSAVTVRLAENGTDAVIAVHNQGTVPVDVRDRFFEKYATSSKAGGTGLGTYTARLMAEAQNGTIEMRTDDEDGTTVTVRLPLAR